MLSILYRDLTDFSGADRMTIICQYYDFCKKTKFAPIPPNAEGNSGEGWPWQDYWKAFLSGFSYRYKDPSFKDGKVNRGVVYDKGIFIPIIENVFINGVAYKDELREKMLSILQANGVLKPPMTEINVGTNMFDGEAPAVLAKPVLDAWWGTNSASTRLIENFANAQRDKVKELLLLNKMSEDIYFYLLHLLIGLGTTGKNDQTMAQHIVSTTASSDEYPNDIFINQLLYMALLRMADPNGTYKYDRDHIFDMLRRTRDCIHSKDEASSAIKTTVEQQMAIINADTSYPWTDPYNPTVDLNTRLANALTALDEARKNMKL